MMPLTPAMIDDPRRRNSDCLPELDLERRNLRELLSVGPERIASIPVTLPSSVFMPSLLGGSEKCDSISGSGGGGHLFLSRKTTYDQLPPPYADAPTARSPFQAIYPSPMMVNIDAGPHSKPLRPRTRRDESENNGANPDYIRESWHRLQHRR